MCSGGASGDSGGDGGGGAGGDRGGDGSDGAGGDRGGDGGGYDDVDGVANGAEDLCLSARPSISLSLELGIPTTPGLLHDINLLYPGHRRQSTCN